MISLKKLKVFSFVSLLLLLTIISNAQEAAKSENIPPAMREMRAVWVATVANIDWPSKPGLSTEEQQKEAIVILDRVKKLKMNAVVLQVRPHADAMYKSDIEPWSYYLTGQQGKAPEPFYDPLEFWVAEAHKRGLELHTWFNPYRANHSANRGELASNSIVKAKPHLVKKLGNAGYYWMDPALQEVQDHSYNVVMDVVKRYDIDAVHFDDYFYPYRDYNEGKDFPDDDSYKAYKDNGGTMERDDWRRDAVNKFVKRIYEGIKKEKPAVKFGISPFGIYRPKQPAVCDVTFDQYAILYADAKLWLNEGWIDYYTPQLYWTIQHRTNSFPALLTWWAAENKKQRNLWPGLYIRPETKPEEMAPEIANQIMITRGMLPESSGTILFSMKPLIPEGSIFEKTLTDSAFTSPSLVPAFPWLDKDAPESPSITAKKSGEEIKITWKAEGKEKPFLYVLYSKIGQKWHYEILPENTTECVKKIEGKNYSAFAVSAVDRCGNESIKNTAKIE